MKLLFREVRADEVEQEMTQRDQFNTDEVGLTETLVRETHQNSLDARAAGSTGPIRTMFSIVDPNPDHGDYWRTLLSPLAGHLQACGIDTTAVDLAMPRLLVIEDFGTIGLTGAASQKDTGNFSDFWRRVGRSHKGGTQGGRWGLGKLVFSSSSRIRTFFGLTIRRDESERVLLMGQAVLATHKIGTKEYAPHGFFANEGNGGFQLPVSDPAEIESFRRAAGIRRSTEPGLSVAIPFVSDELQLADLVPPVVRNYFFPILTGKLEVEIGDQTINRETFDELGKKFGGSALADGHLVGFVRDIQAGTGKDPDVLLSPAWTRSMESALDEPALKKLRDMYADRKLIHVRAPILLKRKDGTDENSFFDLFLRLAEDGVRGQSLYIRGSITLPGENQFFRTGQAFGALIATDGPIVAFLGDAENPAHTRWNGNAEKLALNWKNPATRLREIRASLNGLYDLLARAVERLDNDALIRLLSIKESGVRKKTTKPDPVIKPPVVPPLSPRPKPYTVVPRRGGFAVKAGSAAPQSEFPIRIRVRAAYDLLRGDPFRKHSPFDFDFTKGGLEITESGATCIPVAANELLVEANDPTFAVEVTGFDIRRDLLVRTSG